jgi:hypothetical protein
MFKSSIAKHTQPAGLLGKDKQDLPLALGAEDTAGKRELL